MSGRTDESLAAEAARRRRELREEQDRHDATRGVLRESNRLALSLAFRGCLADPRDFEVYIGSAVVTDGAGRVDWARAHVLVDELLQQRPYLAAPRGLDNLRAVGGVLSSLATGTSWPTAAVHAHGAQGATRDRPGAGEIHSP